MNLLNIKRGAVSILVGAIAVTGLTGCEVETPQASAPEVQQEADAPEIAAPEVPEVEPAPTEVPAAPAPAPEVYEPEAVEVEYVPAPPAAEMAVSGQQATVVRVIDGDTIVVTVDGAEERVRFVGVDTPERGEAGFDEATAFTQAAIDNSGGVVFLERSGADRDRFGRLRRIVHLSDGANLNDMLVRSGHAVTRG